MQKNNLVITHRVAGGMKAELPSPQPSSSLGALNLIEPSGPAAQPSRSSGSEIITRVIGVRCGSENLPIVYLLRGAYLYSPEVGCKLVHG